MARANGVSAGRVVQLRLAGPSIRLSRSPSRRAYQALVLGGTGDGFAWAWQLGLYPLDEKRTRLVSRNHVRIHASLGSSLFMRVIEPAAFLMTRRMLLGLKRRAQTLAVARGDRSAPVA